MGETFFRLILANCSSNRCDEIYGIFRCRPLTLRTGLATRMTPASAGNLSKELGQFFNWLEATEDFQWEKPKRFHKIVKTPVKLTPEEQYRSDENRKSGALSRCHRLKTLFEYALPIESVLSCCSA